jgi:hypothetical protein
MISVVVVMLISRKRNKVLNGIAPSTVRFFGTAFSITIALVSIIALSVFTAVLMFGYFHDVVYEVIFLFLILAVSVNSSVQSIVRLVTLFYGKAEQK